MDGSMNMVVELNQSRYFILYVGIHGGSGFGANEPYDGRFYLVEKEFFEKNRDTYHMVHDSLLPKAWNYYEKNGYFLCSEHDFATGDAESSLRTVLERTDRTVLALFCEKTEQGQTDRVNCREYDEGKQV